MECPQIPLAEITTAQASSPIFAYDRGQQQRTLIRLQRFYAAKLAQMKAFHPFFDKGQPNIALSRASQELALRLPACPPISKIYSALRDGLADKLRVLKKPIAATLLNIERDERETKQYKHSAPAYLAAIHALCTPAVPTMEVLVPSRTADSLASNAA